VPLKTHHVVRTDGALMLEAKYLIGNESLSDRTIG
jgi:hypothetical protein